MIEITTRCDRVVRAAAFDQMFRARCAVFHDRLGWEVQVRDGWEVDWYDDEADPVYVWSVGEAGLLTGSLRLLPTTGEIMLRNEFAGFFDVPVNVMSPTAWECTRFCVHPSSPAVSWRSHRRVSTELLIGLCQFGLASGIEQIVGLYYEPLVRIYSRIGWSPSPLAGTCGDGRLVVGIWDVSAAALSAMQQRFGDDTDLAYATEEAA